MLNKIFLISIFLIGLAPAQSDTLLIFSEIMFSPATGNNEFIEIYNLSSTYSINLSDYKIKYYTSAADQIVGAGFGTTLSPNSYAIVFENDYDIASGIYNGIVPESALILKIADNSFGSSGMANTSSRPLWLLNALNDTVDYYFYSANNATAISDEKIILNHDSLQTNWANSLVTNGTPGFINSVTPLNYDLQLNSLIVSPSVPIAGDNVTIYCTIKNIGILAASNYSIEIFNDANKDSIGDLSERIFNQSYSNILPLDSITVSTILNSLPAANYQIMARVVFLDDQNIVNNFRVKQFMVSPPGNNFKDIVINEIMYAPATTEPEWIELYNRTAETINLKNWKLSDAATTITITTQDNFLPANSFIVISKDTIVKNFYSVPSEVIAANIPLLNNTGDAVVVKDFNNIKIDSVYYVPEWGGSTGGKSLERIDYNDSSNTATNWKTSKSIFKATPGNINSVTQKDFDVLVSDIQFSPIYPMLGDNVNIASLIKNVGKNSSTFSVELFEDTNLDSIPDLLLESIPNLSLTSGDSAEIHFNFYIQYLQAKKGLYVKVVFSQDQDTTNNYFYKTIEPGYPSQTIVVNEIMFAPLGGEPEWLELYNNSNLDINLKDWSVSDVVTTPVSATIKNDFIITANSFIVLTKDSSINNYHRSVPSQVLEINLPSFNNDRDGVVLRDNRHLTIDSVLYSNQWGGTNGFSLERILSTSNSNNQFNWASSKDIEQSTPGRINSVTPKVFDLSVSEISFSPRFPTNDDDVLITAKIKNNGSVAAQNFTTEFYIDTDSNNVADKLLSYVTSTNLSSGDSILVVSSSPILSLQREVLVAVKVLFISDEDTLNNYFEKSIQPGFPLNVIKINEVMYNPDDGKPEWVELVNVSADSINIKNWLISDILLTPTKNFITNENIFINPNEIFIVAKDTSFNSAYIKSNAKVFYSNFGNLGNTSDGVILFDFRNGIIDSLFYSSSWGGKKGYSLERISLDGSTNDSTNWVTSLDLSGSTPGKQNSIFNIPIYERNTFVINEIMFNPEPNNSEYIEFYNLSFDSVNVGGWKIEDENGNINKLFETSFIIPPKEYFVLSADSNSITKFDLTNYNYKNVLNISSLGLVNTGEMILLKDVRGKVIDSVFYSDKWNNKNIASANGKSLERINPNLDGNDPLNWSTSVNSLGGTPGKQNSIFAENLIQSANISINPNPFSPDNDGFEDFTIINYNLSQPIAQVRIKIFDSKGRLIRNLINNQASGSSGSVVFDGLNDDGQTLRMGIYIIFLEALNDNSGVVETVKSVVVVARKL